MPCILALARTNRPERLDVDRIGAEQHDIGKRHCVVASRQSGAQAKHLAWLERYLCPQQHSASTIDRPGQQPVQRGAAQPVAGHTAKRKLCDSSRL